MITLDYEWSVIRGRRPYRWTIWVCDHSPFFLPFQCEILVGNNLICFQIYSLTRVATLATVALNLFSIDVTTRINCQACVILFLYVLIPRFLIA